MVQRLTWEVRIQHQTFPGSDVVDNGDWGQASENLPPALKRTETGSCGCNKEVKLAPAAEA
jgi:hypothetical protein